MDIGTALAIGIPAVGVSFSMAAVIITVVKTKASGAHRADGVCPLHSGIEATITYVKSRIDDLEEIMTELRNDIKNVLVRMGERNG